METRQLRYFVAIYEHGTLSGAAETTRIAASALSHHMSNMEAEFGSALFARKPRGMQPTAAGERLYVHAKAILRAMAAAERDIRQAGGEISGEVSVGMAYSAVKAIGVSLAKKVLADYPKLRLSLTESLSGSTLMHLMASEVDLALVYNPPVDPRLKTEAVLEERMVCVGKKEIIGDTGDPIPFRDLLELPIILLRQGVSARAIMDDVGLLKKIEAKAKLQMNSVQAISGSLLAGLGCVIGTKLFMQEHLESGALHFRPIVEPELSRTLYICEMAERPATFALETVRREILELVADAVHIGIWEARLLSGQSDGRN
ncbi:LysR family transcriptional regulator [Pseudaminobacter sp. 19-2017]|uniref:LysR family transcriptional regulator n=1 Tax=Pseudaminobacter soli (ex Zhang et al. 2022) TaxID=2831468 RepID=A0A942E110_9HYPH|nr:LysR substrate-binding domain-containing protein [Pseudaminobacter soli]MBS3651779.1 LysR family transcriptional regulator [Pseudaminobacter soli]